MFSNLLFAILALFSLSTTVIAVRYPSFGTIRTTKNNGILNAVINNTFSSVNIFDEHFMADLGNLIQELQANDTDVRVVVFSSANKDFFMAHIDLNYFTPAYIPLQRISGAQNISHLCFEVQFRFYLPPYFIINVLIRNTASSPHARSA